jgi:putative ABC transport system permease protein
MEAVRHAIRGLARRPAYAFTVIATLSLGIAASTAIFTVVDALIVRPIPFPEPHELVVISEPRSPDAGADLEALEVWRSQERVFADVKARLGTPVILTGAGEARSYRAEMVEPGFLELLGLRPVLGRALVPEDVTGDGRVVLLSDHVWGEAFGRDPDAVGRSVELNGDAHTVVGVLPPTLRLMPGGIVHLLVPMSDPPPYDRVPALGRLRDDVPLDVAQERLAALAEVLTRERPREDGWEVRLWPVSRMAGSEIRQGLLALSAAVLCLLLIACANAAGLLLLRGVSRRPEFHLRAALGASRASLLGTVLVESLILAMAAGLLGTLFARWSVQGLVALLPSGVVRFSYNAISVDERVLGFCLLLTLVTGIAFGLLPAWHAASNATGNMRRTATASRDEVRLRATMQVAQLALALMLLAGAGLFGRSFGRLLADDPGYEADRVLQLHLVSLERLQGEGETIALARELDERLRGLPGVTSVSRASSGTGFMFDFTLETPEREPWEPSSTFLPHQRVDTAYFRTMGIPILEGRGFTPADVEAGDAVVVDRDLAEALWPGQAAVGRSFRIRSDPWLTVVGVTDDVKLDGPREPYGPYFLFYPAGQEDLRAGMVAIRGSGDPKALAPAVRQLVAEVDPDQPIRSLRTGGEAILETVADPRLLAVIMTFLAGAAMLLAAVGVYGLVSFNVAQQRREIGVRVALGARAGRVMLEVLRSGLLLGLLGIGIGVGVTAFASRLLSSLLYQTPPFDPAVIALAAVTLLASCAVALIAPARRAAAADPAEALRAE